MNQPSNFIKIADIAYKAKTYIKTIHKLKPNYNVGYFTQCYKLLRIHELFKLEQDTGKITIDVKNKADVYCGKFIEGIIYPDTLMNIEKMMEICRDVSKILGMPSILVEERILKILNEKMGSQQDNKPGLEMDYFSVISSFSFNK